MMDYAQEIGKIKVEAEGIKHDVNNLTGWQKRQNGAIHRVEEKVDKLIFWGLTFCAGNLIGLVVAILLILVKG